MVTTEKELYNYLVSSTFVTNMIIPNGFWNYYPKWVSVISYRYTYIYICTPMHVCGHIYMQVYIPTGIVIFKQKSLVCVFSLFFKDHHLEQMEYKGISLLCYLKEDHKVQNRPRAACEQPRGTDASAKEEGAEIRRGEWEWQQLGWAQELPTKLQELLPSICIWWEMLASSSFQQTSSD